MAQEVFFRKAVPGLGEVQASVQYDAEAFGVGTCITPWTVAIEAEGHDLGRIVGFEGEAQHIIAMHGLKPDPQAKRGLEMTVFRVSEALRANSLDAQVFAAFERWLLRRGWRGNLLKRLKFTDPQWVIPIRSFWVQQLGFELVLAEEGKWDEHVVKRWR